MPVSNYLKRATKLSKTSGTIVKPNSKSSYMKMKTNAPNQRQTRVDPSALRIHSRGNSTSLKTLKTTMNGPGVTTIKNQTLRTTATVIIYIKIKLTLHTIQS
jgi:hypothetical protein